MSRFFWHSFDHKHSRFGTGEEGEWIGGVSRESEGWHAVRYTYPNGQETVTDLGHYECATHSERS